MSKVICCDIDGVLADFTTACAQLLIDVDGQDRFPEGWRTSPDWPKVWDWDIAAGYSPAIIDEVWKEHILQEGSKFWQELEPLPFARESLGMLNARQRSGDMVWFVSHRMGNKAHKQTLNWLYNHGMDYPCLFFVADKIPYLRLLGTNFFVDDKPTTIQEVTKVSSTEAWKDFQLFLRDAPYNRHVTGVKKATSAKDALEQAGLWIG